MGDICLGSRPKKVGRKKYSFGLDVTEELPLPRGVNELTQKIFRYFMLTDSCDFFRKVYLRRQMPQPFLKSRSIITKIFVFFSRNKCRNIFWSSPMVPVVTCDAFVLPFMEVIDWRSTALLYYGRSKSEVRDLIKEVKIDHINRLRLKGKIVEKMFWLFSVHQNVSR